MQCLYTGGTVLHAYLSESVEDTEACKRFIQKIFSQFKLPYLSITPTFSVCDSHGFLSGEHFKCPSCGKACEVWSRVTGYLRPVENYNEGKRQEYADRKKFDVPEFAGKAGAAT